MKPIKPYPIQYKALEYLFDNETTMIMFGGSVRSSKTYLLAMWATAMCMTYYYIAGAIGRATLKSLTNSTLQVMEEFWRNSDIIEGRDYHFNRQSNIITFTKTKSKIFLVELQRLPSDLSYQRLYGMSLTFAIIDEAEQIEYAAVEALFSRLSLKLKDYNITGKLLVCSNPCKGWLYDKFYLPYRDGTLPSHIKVVLGLPTDNPSAGQEYVDQQLKVYSYVRAQRYLYGNWEIDDDEGSLMTYDNLAYCFDLELKDNNKTNYLSCDVAGPGADKTVICIWIGLELIDIFIYSHYDIPMVVKRIKELMILYNIQDRNVVIDNDGLGQGVGDFIPLAYKFKAQSKLKLKNNDDNIKYKSIMKLVELVNKGEIKFPKKNNDIREKIINELLVVKFDNNDSIKTQIIDKNKMKKILGRSPDILDAIFMRLVFLLKKSPNIYVTGF